MWTASVSPGSAPSTKKGPVWGLSCPGTVTLDMRSAAVFREPSKQSSVQVITRVPGRIRRRGGAPPNVYTSSSCLGTHRRTGRPAARSAAGEDAAGEEAVPPAAADAVIGCALARRDQALPAASAPTMPRGD
jgi:hypothetical protein